MRASFLTFFFFCLTSMLPATSFASSNISSDSPKPSIEKGAVTFKERCELCHGRDGYGEGRLPLLIKGYKKSNLIHSTYPGDQVIRQSIIYGGVLEKLSAFMPPWGAELSWTEIESLTLYVKMLHTDFKQALAVYEKVTALEGLEITLSTGHKVYTTRCVLCHGEDADGKGRMARVIKTPPPANLVLSRLDDEHLEKIVRLGGEGVSRSPQMPPWEDELSTEELKSVLAYIKSIRK